MNDSLFSDIPPSVEPSAPSSRKWLYYSVLASGGLLALLAIAVLIGPSTESNVDEPEDVDPVEIAQQEERRLLEQLIENAIQPARLGAEADESTTAQELNRWWLEYGPGSAESLTYEPEYLSSLQTFMGADAANLATANTFSRKDVAHLATALSMRLAGLTLTTPLTSDREKVTRSFYFVVRNMQIVSNASAQPSTFPYQALLWGRGRAEDRIWAFVELLRQIRIDAVLVTPADDENAYPLVGVVIDEGILLFDPILGLPIPSLTADADDDALPMMAATYSEALGNDEVFRQLDATDTAYPWSSEALHNVKLLLVGADPTFSPRMEALQKVLPASGIDPITFDGWSLDTTQGNALQRRIEAATERLADVHASVGVWSYPLVQAASYDLENGIDGSQLASIYLRLKAPTVRTLQTDPETEEISEVIVTAAQTMQDVRSLHIQGEFEDAMRGYLPMRSSYQQYATSENREAVELAGFWTAICQFELQRSDLSIPGLQVYFRDYPSGQFIISANYWLAVSQAIQHDFEAALETLQRHPPSAIPDAHFEYLAKRWSRLQQQSPVESEESISAATTNDDRGS